MNDEEVKEAIANNEEVKEEITKIVRKMLVAAENEKKKQERQKVLHNTRMLMENYREMRRHLESAISEVEELKTEEFQIFKTAELHLESVRKSKLYTALMIANIDRALEELKAEQEEKGASYKYEAFRMHYIDGISFEDIAESLNCGKNTPSRWTKEMIRRISVKLFGIDGIEKW